MPRQNRNAELVELLDTDFVGRSEPNYAWKSAVSSYMYLLGLRGLWPMSAFNATGDTIDQSGNMRTLTYNGSLVYSNSNLLSHIDFDGINDFLSRGDEAGLDILGTESYVNASFRGLTLGGWFFISSLDAASQGLITKGTSVAATSAYEMFIFATTDVPRFRVSNGAYVGIDGPVLTTGIWYFIVGRYIPSTSVSIFVNETESLNVVGVPASISNVGAGFEIGAFHPGNILHFHGRASLCFLCAAALPNGVIGTLFENTRAMFNV